MNHESKRPIAIEDLLRLKRTERPPAEFWQEFDRNLRAKQLSALVVKRPWWQSMPRVFSGFSRYHLPIGAAAILTVTFVSVHDFRSVVPGQLDQPKGTQLGAVVPAAATSFAPGGENRENVSRDSSQVAATATATATIPEASSSARLASDSATAVEVSRILPLLGAGEQELPGGDAALFPRFVGTSLKVTQPLEPVISRSLVGAGTGFENRVMPARLTVEPLQQMTPPSERSRSRLLTAMVSMVSTEAQARSSGRVADSLSEERLYDQIHRFGARGAGVSMKF